MLTKRLIAVAGMSESSELRCSWCVGSELYESYHDTEWGVPCRDSLTLFEMINLEGAQAGLSWITILKKREAYRRLFKGFDPASVARMTDTRLDRIAADPAIVRHRQKVEAVRANARVWLDMRERDEEFARFVWSYVDDQPVQNNYKTLRDVPGKTEISTRMSRDLKKRGFKFVGATTCYAFMQAAGLVNDHLTTCPQHAVLSQA